MTLHPTTFSFSSQNPRCTHTSLQNLPAHSKNAHDHTRDAVSLQAAGTSVLHAGKTTRTSNARPRGGDRKNLRMDGSINVRGCSVSYMSMRYINRMCSVAERLKTTIARVVRKTSEGGDERRMGRMCSMTLDKRLNTRRKIACHRRVQKSASVVAVNGASNIRGPTLRMGTEARRRWRKRSCTEMLLTELFAHTRTWRTPAVHAMASL